MWRIHKSTLDSNTECWQLLAGTGKNLSFGRVFLNWRTDEGFRVFWSESLRDVSFDSYCWECPAVTARNLECEFECVFVSSPLLDWTSPNQGPFAEHFRPGCMVATFESLGKDALLVVPCPGMRDENFAHLASFVTTASERRKSALWKAVGTALETRLGTSPTWLNTAGLGVSWLHVRLDTQPKYYRHAPYRHSTPQR